MSPSPSGSVPSSSSVSAESRGMGAAAPGQAAVPGETGAAA
ncbi:NUDIX domain-containing protein, partial [Micrococcus endophyticus]